MRYWKTALLIIVGATTVLAGPRHRHDHHHRHYRHPVVRPHYHPHYSYGVRYRSYYTPVVTTKRVVIQQPRDMVRITAEQVAEELSLFQSLKLRGIISEKDYQRVKRTLLNRVGIQIDQNAIEFTPIVICMEIETLYQMLSNDLLTENEFKKQKSELLAIL